MATMINNVKGDLHLESHSGMSSGKHPSKELINSKGKEERTLVFSPTLEDAACRPREEKPQCYQCGKFHHVHLNDWLNGMLVTEDPEIYKRYCFFTCVTQCILNLKLHTILVITLI